MGWFIISIILGIICVYLLIDRYFTKMQVDGLRDSIKLTKKWNEAASSELKKKMKEGFNAKSKALGKSEELRMKVISELEEKQVRFERLERDLETSHELYNALLKDKEALIVEFVQFKDHYEAIEVAVNIPKEFQIKFPEISEKTNAKITKCFSELTGNENDR